jgi:hypothetical protein
MPAHLASRAAFPFPRHSSGISLASRWEGPVQIPKLFRGKDRLFFMSNYEGFRLRNQTQVVYSTPPEIMRTGDFSQILPNVIIKDPANDASLFRTTSSRDGRLGDRLVDADYRNFAPPLGIAWSPAAKWTVRAGAGILYVQDTGNPRFDMSRNIQGASPARPTSSLPI